MDLKGKVAIVTGGGTGMGKAISTLLGAAGVNVIVNYSRSEADAVATAEELTKGEVKALPIRADVSNAADVAAMVEQAEREFGRLDFLVNNAGYTQFVPMNDLDGMPEEEWDKIMDVNVKGIWLCSKAVAPAMRRSGGGAICNVASIAGLKVAGSSMAYAVSKAAAIHLTKCLALALAPDIRVNAVAPGLVVTRWWAHASEERLAQITDGLPLKRSVSPEQVATTMFELLTNEAVTGQTVALDSGALLP
ncbi:MAG: SDR family oxidoreductase [Chloroflexi bacterium]|nr:SDR family oxidoreductase [Chloroflexota bacterium]